MVHISENSQNTLVPYSAYNSPVNTKSDDSFVTILTNSELHCATPHTPSYKYTQLPPVHPPGKHLRSTTSNITTPHDTDSTQDSTHPYIAILTTIYTKYLLLYLLVCMFACSCYIVIGAFVPSRGGQIRKSTLGGGARSQFRELPFPLRRISTTSSLDPFDA
jgi:hypothetical protein